MDNQARNTAPYQYQPFAGEDRDVSDNKIGLSEYIIRDCLLHAYEEGYHHGLPKSHSTVGLLIGAAITCGCSAFASWALGRLSEALIWFSITLVVAVLTTFIYFCFERKKVPTFDQNCKDRDATVDKQIVHLFKASTARKTNNKNSRNANTDDKLTIAPKKADWTVHR